jgi:RNA polymerase sigma-70 factor (ECF subfamily)
MLSTPITLLERLRRRDDAAAWAQFVRLYTPLLWSWARRAGLSKDDAADLLQDVFATLVRELPAFE